MEENASMYLAAKMSTFITVLKIDKVKKFLIKLNFSIFLNFKIFLIDKYLLNLTKYL